MKLTKMFLVALLIGWIFAYFALDMGQYFTLGYFRAQEAELRDYYAREPWPVLLGFAVIYMIVAVPSLPGAALMTLAAGALFGVGVGTVLISLTSVIAAILTFLSSRFLLRDMMQTKFAASLRTVNAGVAKDGGLYLFVLRLSPIFPFFIVNVLMGLTTMPLWTFIWVTQLGVIPGSAIFVAAGTEFSDLDDLSGILSPRLAIYLTLLGLLPIVTRRLIAWARLRKLYRPYARPRHYDRNVVVIGGSAAAVIAANAAAAVKASVTLIEPGPVANASYRNASIPSKILLRISRFLFEAQRARDGGLVSARARCDFPELMTHAQHRQQTNTARSEYLDPSVDMIVGLAKIESPYAVRVRDRVLTTRSIIIATGSRSHIPNAPGLEEYGYFTTDTVLNMRELPQRLLVIGAGPSGSELAQCFARLGSRVTVIEQQRHLLPTEDEDIAAMLEQQFLRDGIQIEVGTTVREIMKKDGYATVVCERGDDSATYETKHFDVDQIIVATGRKPNIDDLGVQKLGIAAEGSPHIVVDEHMQTLFPNVFACGEVAIPLQFTDAATDAAWYASLNALFRWRKHRFEYALLPWTILTNPSIARVGYNEKQARAEGLPYVTHYYALDEFSRHYIRTESAVTSQRSITVKLLNQPGNDKVIGVTILGPHAEELISEYAAMLRYGMDPPPQAIASRALAGLPIQDRLDQRRWPRGAQMPTWLEPWMIRFHNWQRGQQPSSP